MMRNLGGAIGIAVTETFVTNREKYHSAIINPASQPAGTRPPVERIDMLQRYFRIPRHSPTTPPPSTQAIIAIGRSCPGPGLLPIAYGDAFGLARRAAWSIGGLAVLFLKKLPPPTQGGAPAH